MAGENPKNKNPGRNPVPDDIHQAARLLWETQPAMTHGEVADAFSLSIDTVRYWSSQENWSKVHKTHKGQVVPLPKRTLNVVRREIAQSDGQPLTDEQSRWLALREHHKLRDERARVMDSQQRQLAQVMINALVQKDERQIARLKVGIDALTKVHKQQMNLWRMTEGDVPCMTEYKILELATDSKE